LLSFIPKFDSNAIQRYHQKRLDISFDSSTSETILSQKIPGKQSFDSIKKVPNKTELKQTK